MRCLRSKRAGCCGFIRAVLVEPGTPSRANAALAALSSSQLQTPARCTLPAHNTTLLTCSTTACWINRENPPPFLELIPIMPCFFHDFHRNRKHTKQPQADASLPLRPNQTIFNLTVSLAVNHAEIWWFRSRTLWMVPLRNPLDGSAQEPSGWFRSRTLWTVPL